MTPVNKNTATEKDSKCRQERKRGKVKTLLLETKRERTRNDVIEEDGQ